MKTRLSLILTVYFLVLSFSLSGLTQAGNPREPREPQGFESGTQSELIKSLRLVTAGRGWVLTTRHLLWTRDNGRTWEDIAPREVGSRTLLNAFFVDESNGWLVSLGPTADGYPTDSLRIGITSDGGKTWSEHLVTIPGNEETGTFFADASSHFVDTQHGWLMLRLASSSNFSRGLLLRTLDGGKTWDRLLDPPTGDPVRFITTTDGWIAGGVRGDELYVSRDGGETWNPKSVSLPVNTLDGNPTYDLPQFQNDREGVLPVTIIRDGRATLLIFETHDGGETWQRRMSTNAFDTSLSNSITFSIVGVDKVVTIPAGQRSVTVFDRQGTPSRRHLPAGLSEETSFTSIEFVTETSGWLLAKTGRCESYKSNCRQESRLFSTSDGGLSLTEITPFKAASATIPNEGASSISDDDPVGINSVITLQNREGFDKCEIATVSQMQTWYNNSPYRGVGFYIGGSARACANSGLSTSWVNSVSGMGWGLIPIWVGPQAPNSNYTSRISYDTATAESQGVTEANLASDRAAAIGLTSPTIIYYDMEAYNRNDASARNAVRAFVNGWVRRIRQRGNIAGIYSSHPEFQDWHNLTYVPDAIWFAWFFQTGVPCGTQCHKVFDVPSFSNSLWNNHQRLRQTSSTIDRCWGQVCFTGNGGIDEDYFDGPVASTGGGGCSTSVGQGTSGSEATAFQNAFNNAGGQGGLGCANSSVRSDGFTSFSGTVGHYQTFANGDIEYLSNGSRAGQAYALIGPFSTKWAQLGYTSSNPLGYPIEPRVAGTPSCSGTSHEYQSFEGGSLTRHLSGSRAGSVFEVHGAIHAKWRDKGFASCPLGLPVGDERTATPSAVSGRTGRVSDFERGHIHWWTGAAQAYETHGAIDSLYTSMGGTASWLGFPTSDEYVASTGFARSDFEGGYITTLNGVDYRAFSNSCNGPGSFSLESPSNSQSLSERTTVTLSWGASANATSYDLYFGTSSNPGFLANQSGTSRSVSVTPGQTYWWKVVGKVSCGSSTSVSSTWSFTVQQNFTLTLSAVPSNGGTVSGGGTFAGGTSRTVVATPNSGFSFEGWAWNGGRIVSRTPTYTFILDNDTSLQAHFVSTSVNFTISVNSSPSNGGTVSGSGTFESGTTRTVTAAPNSGFRFENWTENGVSVSTSPSYTFVLNANRSLVANFTANPTTYLVQASALPSNAGSVSGGGTFAAGSSRTVHATANSGFVFANWTENGIVVSNSSSYTWTLNSNRTLVANFSAGQSSAVLQFSSASAPVLENATGVLLVVTRSGNTSVNSSVFVSTIDDTAATRCDTVNGTAYSRCDYATTVERLTFVPGEATKAVVVPIIDDGFAEGNEQFVVRLSHVSGATLGTNTSVVVTINDNEQSDRVNPISSTSFLLRQHYLDFLSREPDAGGFNAWSNVLNGCSDVNNNPSCDRVTVSGAFFGSAEFQLKGYFVYRFYKLAFNRLPTYSEIVLDMRAVTGQTPSEVYQKKGLFTDGFVQNAEFATQYNNMTNAQYVATLMGRYNLAQITTPDPAQPDGANKVTLTAANLTNQLIAGSLSRAQVLRAIAESDQVFNLEYNAAFVAMQYFGYLRRSPDAAGYNAWLNYLNTHPGDSRTMVNGFMNSTEYRLRFGP